MKKAQEKKYHMEWNQFTFKKFVLTGKEMFIEMRSSLHTNRGKGGLVVFLLSIFWGFYSIKTEKQDVDMINLLLPALWSVIGLGMMTNLQNHKLLYLLPVSRKEFAAGQLRRMIWSMIVVLIMLVLLNLYMNQDVKSFWINTIWKLIPASISFSIYQIASVKPIKESDKMGTQVYHLSWLSLLLCIGIGFANFIVPITITSSILVNLILPVLNYAVNSYILIYFYKRISYSDFYYDEL